MCGALPTALEWTALLSIPLLTAATTSGSEPFGGLHVFRRYVLVALVLSLALAIKYGTGNYHFLPFVPLIVFGADFKRWQALGPAAVFTACVLIAAAAISTWLPALTALPSHRMIEELRTIERSNAGSLAMGWLYDQSLTALVVFGLAMQICAAAIFFWLRGPLRAAAAE